jgi:hypothetical protein
MARVGFARRTAGVTIALLLVAAPLALGAGESRSAQASSRARELAPAAQTRVQAIRARVDARYRHARGGALAVAEASSTGVLESYSLLTPELTGSRLVSAANGIYYAICPAHARCPYPPDRVARPADDLASRRVALELAARTFLETSADLVVVSLPTRDFTALVVQRQELAEEVDLPALAKALSGDPARRAAASLEELVDRLTRPLVFVALGLETTASGRSSWAGMPRWPTLPTGGERALLATSAAPTRIRFELMLDGAQRSGPGTFRSLAPFCAGGHVVDLGRGLSGRWISGLRRFSCSDGSGSVTVRTWLIEMDEAAASESGVWRIVAGNGAYASLRGKGAYARVLLEGDGGSTSARETWAGDAAVDAAAPTVAISGISAARASTPGWSVVRIAFSTSDRDRRSPVDFLVSASNRYLLAARSGTTATGTAVVALRVRAGRGGRTIRLKLEASDRVGNTTTIVRRLQLPADRHKRGQTPDSSSRPAA